MGKNMLLLKFYEIIDFVENMTNEDNITQLELTPIPFAEDKLFITGFRIDTTTPYVHIKQIGKLKIDNNTQQQLEYYMMNPDAELWINMDALDANMLNETIEKLNNELHKNITLDILHISYKDNGKDVERNIAYNSKRIACKDAMTMRKIYTNFKLHFSQTKNKQITDLEFATAPLEYVTT
jgi:hypothetical protein